MPLHISLADQYQACAASSNGLLQLLLQKTHSSVCKWCIEIFVVLTFDQNPNI